MLLESFPDDHPYRLQKPLGNSGLFLNGKPTKAGDFTLTTSLTNLWGSLSSDFSLTVEAIPPRIRTGSPREIGSTSARLSADMIETGGEDANVSFVWGISPDSLNSETNSTPVSEIGETFSFLTGLSPDTTYYYQARAINSAGQSNGEDLSSIPHFHWELDDLGTTALDKAGNANGQIWGAVNVNDSEKGRVLDFDGSNDYVNFGDLDEMDQVKQFTLSLWFKRENENTDQTVHGIRNLLVGQSSSGSNDNFEIGTRGTNVQVYLDSGTASTQGTVTFDSGITNGIWYHLALVYGSELSLYLNGTKLTTWTQYNGRLESSLSSPFSLGVARPNSDMKGDFEGRMSDVRIYLTELSKEEISILAGKSSVAHFTTGDLL
jgi:hypothetical protein